MGSVRNKHDTLGIPQNLKTDKLIIDKALCQLL
jgi:hypothetical protein